MIEAIIFDWGGVLIEEPEDMRNSYCARYFKVPKSEFARVYDKFKHDFGRGIISEETFWKNICLELKVDPPNRSLWLDACRHVYSEKKDVISIASSLHKNGYKIGLLSNTELPSMKYFCEQKYDMFDICVFSCMEGVIKPERKIYELALERLGVAAKSAVFIDDKENCTDGAKIIGMNAILFKTPEQLKKELALLGVK
ncbi:MAG: HAD family phosphatase [Candidatus Woesearchaeota archaeon]|nr:HAD family phosphatase [Candidatus Woesearchaeota archaeon]